MPCEGKRNFPGHEVQCVETEELNFSVPERHKPFSAPIVWPPAAAPLFHFVFTPDLDRFYSFSASAKIPSSNESLLPFPSQHQCYNDDLKLPFYSSSARTFAGKQRKGVIDEHLDCDTITEHVYEALDSPFFLSLKTPLPTSTTEAALFSSGQPQPSSHPLLEQSATRHRYFNRRRQPY